MDGKKLAIMCLIIMAIGIVLFIYYANDNSHNNSKISSVCIKDKCFNVEIADSFNERQTGLMNRTYMNGDKGMLFVFDNSGRYSFWMKDTLISLDIIWIDENGKAVFIKDNAMPCLNETCETFTNKEDAKYVLELNGGTADVLRIKEGDKVEFKS